VCSSDLGQGARQPVQIVLVGQPELEQIVKRKDLEQLKQRIRVHYKLEPLTREELLNYIDHRMSVAGGEAGTFDRKAIDRIHRLSEGVPRVVNSLCEEALLTAFLAGHSTVEEKDVESPEIQNQAPEPIQPIFHREPVPTHHEPVLEMPMQRQEVVAPLQMPPRPNRDSKGGILVSKLLVWLLVAAVVVAGLRYALPEQFGSVWRTSSDLGTSPAEVGSPADLKVSESNTNSSQDFSDEATAPAPEIEPNVVLPTKAEFFVHIGSFRDRGRADSLAKQLDQNGNPSAVQRHTVRGSDWFRVIVGPYGGRDAAVQRAETLISDGTVEYYKVITR